MAKVKYFTPPEATRTLPLVRKIVADILVAGQKLKGYTNVNDPDSKRQVERLKTELSKYFKELEQLGCYYKDGEFNTGLVDFPAVIDDVIVLLCWRSDESEIKYYHSLKDGYAGRKPIPSRYFREEVRDKKLNSEIPLDDRM